MRLAEPVLVLTCGVLAFSGCALDVADGEVPAPGDEATDVAVLPQALSYGDHGFAWAHKTTGSYAPYANHSYNSTGGGILINRTSTGKYVARFSGLGLGNNGGNAQAVAYGSDSVRCKVSAWTVTNGGRDLDIGVHCHDHDGDLADSKFVVSFVRPNGGNDGKGGYLWMSNPTASTFEPSAYYSWSSSGGVIRSTRSDTGRYSISFYGQGDDDLGGIRLTAYGTGSEYCNVNGYGFGGSAAEIIDVVCFDTDGELTDTRFSLSYTADGHVEAYNRGAYASALLPHERTALEFNTGDCGQGGSVSFTKTATGVSYLFYDNLIHNKSNAFVVAMHFAPYCKVSSWWESGSGVRAYTRCFDANGTPTDASYMQTYYTKLIRSPC